MSKGSFEKIFQRRFFYVIFSIIASIAIWAYVSYVENPEGTVSVSGIQVNFEGADVLADEGLVATNLGSDTINVNFTGRRNAVTKLNASNVSVTVDLSKVLEEGMGVGAYQLSYTINYPADVPRYNITSTSSSVNFITVRVEKLLTAEVPIKGSYDGTVAKGYQAEPLSFDVNTITVSGPEPIVSGISHANVYLDLGEITGTVEMETGFELVGADGKVVDTTNLTLSQDRLIARVQVNTVKEIELRVELDYGETTDDENVFCSISPEKIAVVGDPAILEELDYLVIDKIDLTSFAFSTKETVDIPLPEGVTSVTGETTANITVEITGLETRKFNISDIRAINTRGYTVDILTQSLEVTLRAKPDVLNALTAGNIRVVIDLSEHGNATNNLSVPATVYIDGAVDVDPIGSYAVSVDIKR